MGKRVMQVKEEDNTTDLCPPVFDEDGLNEEKVEGEGIQVEEAKIKVVKQWLTSTNITKVRSFHSLASFYRRLISYFSSIMALFTKYMKGNKFAWTDEVDDTFHLMKERLATAPILALLDFTHMFELYIDASKVEIGAVLSQQVGPIAFHITVLYGIYINKTRYLLTQLVGKLSG
ncbi:uncharacterized mitochondrial protein AtMg00860-like [Dioscorea cayenensis subsp. rotundata]|uniref:Uncharacterized mitochondrial protein AtMg00860-like n=1 Tax=Dioscorea cayennensis subsp. rotundata TaxID=55577 RepID=A0AB40AM13_DIOCR|nr:uncharacterized mitochondrial protein AtMg00860-like [Dioscorea cayenensis subsp. rotundata]